MAAQFSEDQGRWFKRADGMVFRMDDPDHIKRMLSEGWHEVDGPQSLAPLSPEEELPTASVAVPIAATVAEFTGQRSHEATAKPIKHVRVREGRS